MDDELQLKEEKTASSADGRTILTDWVRFVGDRLSPQEELLHGLKEGLREQLVYGVSGSAGSLLVAHTHICEDLPMLVVTHEREEAKKWAADLKCWLSEDAVAFFPPLEVLPFEQVHHRSELSLRRLDALQRLIRGSCRVVVTTVGSLYRRLPPKEALKEGVRCVSSGDELILEDVLADLVSMGYERTDMVEGRGQFSVRGGLIDVFPPVERNPYRIDLFGDEVDSIRRFDTESQRSTERVDEVFVGPAREMALTEQRLIQGKEMMRRDAETLLSRLRDRGEERKARRLEQRVERRIEEMENRGFCQNAENFLPYFYRDMATLVDYFEEPPVVALAQPSRIAETAQEQRERWGERQGFLLSEGKLLSGQQELYMSWSQTREELSQFPKILLALLPHRVEGFQPEKVISLGVKEMPGFDGHWNLVAEEIRQRREREEPIILFASTEDRREKVREKLSAEGVDVEDLAQPEFSGRVFVAEGRLSRGFELPEVGFACLGDEQIFAAPESKRPTFRQRESRHISDFRELSPGDYVVHVNHGIGQYMGIRNLEIQGANRDYMHLEYRGADRLYVPLHQVDKVQKYVGVEGKTPTLSKLDSKEWDRVKRQVKDSVREMAEELLELYAAREAMEGYAFSEDTEWQKEFEAEFPHEETEDQLRAVQEIKGDMEKPTPMSRLLCGDVGYGKTEVAMRAAFKAVMDGKQVAVLVPTTILAQQHHNTFSRRFREYPVNIDVLSRFRTATEQEATITKLRKGDVDIVIGTHRLLQEDIDFKDLGLLIIDEEHRFGVRQKERLKKLRRRVDVLSMTATPIPRTLHMSLVGLRDMSVIDTPPKDRYPVETFVVEYGEALVRDAILRELDRGGQAFYVHNRVRSIDFAYRRLSKIVPEADIAVGHGQMNERELEQVMIDFLQGEYDVLLCTTIIESGLDMPNVNTLLVEDADKMGLAQLYQLRGRVGRSDRLAFAYFTYRKRSVLTEEAEKRLQALREFNDFGAGFKLALRDLEIRGAGNILGPEQHGFIVSVGFDLYCQLLDEAVQELKGEHKEPRLKPEVEVLVDAFIGDDYVPSSRQKIEMYKKINRLEDLEQVEDMRREFIDRYGRPPEPVDNLLRLARIKIKASAIGVFAIKETDDKVKFEFAAVRSQLVDQARRKLAPLFGSDARFHSGEGPFIEVKLRGREDSDKLDLIEGVLDRLPMSTD